jgi:hypothetical protein
MSSRWPQGQQDQRSPYATYDEAWSQEGGAEQSWQDDGWQAQDQHDYSGQWAQGADWQGPEQQSRGGRTAVAQAVAPERTRAGRRSRNEPEDFYQGDWDQSGGGTGDDDDYAWFQYLSGGRSAEPKPAEDRPTRSGRDSGRRGGRQERPRSRRGRAREPEPGTRPSRRAATDPGYGPVTGPSENVTTGPDLGPAAVGPAGAGGPGHGAAGRRSRHGRPEPAEPEYGQASAAGWPATADWQDAADQSPLPGWPAPDSGYGGADVASWPEAEGSGRHHAGRPGWPEADDRAPDQGHVPGWPAAGDLGQHQDEPPAAEWAAADWRQGGTPVNQWSAVHDMRLDQGPEAGWPGAAGDPRQDQAHVAGWPAAEDLAPDRGQVAGWPAAGDPREDEAYAAGWSAAEDLAPDRGEVAGWPAAGDPRQDQTPPNGWPVSADDGYGRAATAAWPEADQSLVPGWPAADSGYQADAGYQQPSAAVADTGYGWPATADPQQDQTPVPGWPQTGMDYGWPEDDPGYAQPADARSADDAGPAARTATSVKTRERPPDAALAPARDDDTGVADPDTMALRSPVRQRTTGKPAKRAGKQPAVKKQPRGRAANAAAAADGPRLLSPPAPGDQPARQRSRPRSGRKSRSRLSTRVVALAGVSAVAAGAAAFVVLTNSGGGVTHVITIPGSLGAYTEQPQLATQMHAAALRQQIIDQSAGEVHNVVYAVYDDSAGAAASAGPQIILFIGGNLSGTSAGSFISAFTGKLQNAATTSAGTLGGAAACVPSVDGRVAECVWADNDTFGVVASQTLSPAALATEMRTMRPAVEHPASAR